MCWLGLVALLVVAAAPPPEQVARDAQQLSEELMSPFCPGLLLANCPSPNAAALRADITRRLAAGEPRQALLDDLLARYGERLAAAPPAHGWGLLAWMAPVLVVVVGGALVCGWLARHQRRRPVDASDAPPAPADAALAARLDRELRELS